MEVGKVQEVWGKRPADHTPDRTGHPDEPWITRDAITFLEKHLKPDMSVLEYGSGASTAWFARRVSFVTTIEDDFAWFDRVNKNLHNLELSHKVLLILSSATGVTYPVAGRNREYDVAVIDGRRRVDCIRNNEDIVKPGGYLLLDNAERERYGEVRKILFESGWRLLEETSNGLWRTDIYRKPMRVFLGCWKNLRKDCVNVDLYPAIPGVRKDDARTLATFEPGSVDLLLSLHLLEHISHKDVPAMFRRWLEVLRPGGRVVIECPDILSIATEYVRWHENGRSWTDEAALRFVRKKAEALSYRSWHTLFGGTHEHEGHKNGSWWDEWRLRRELEDAGFARAVGESPRESNPQWGPSIRVSAEKPLS